MPKQVSLRLPDDLHSAVSARMRATGATRTSVITEALRASLMDSEADDRRLDSIERRLDSNERRLFRLEDMANG